MRVNNDQQNKIRSRARKTNRVRGYQIERHRLWWRSPFIAYPGALLLTGVALLFVLLEIRLNIPRYFMGSSFILATFLAGSFWGTGPALCAIILGVLSLDYWIITPQKFGLVPEVDLLPFLFFVIVQLIILRLVVVNQKNRQRLLVSEQEAQRQARELARSNAQLEQADQVKDLFLSQASHELKTPVTTIQGQVQLILRRLSRQSPLPENMAFLPTYLAKIDAQTHRLQSLVNDLLNLSSLRSGKVSLRIAPFDLCHFIHEIVQDQKALTDRSIELKLPSCPLVLQADEGRLSQVMNNLIANALKYSPADTTVQVEVSRRPGQVILAVHNDGPVLSQTQQEAIFEPFFRCPEAQSSTASGWGLGLSISKEIVERHGGRIHVESSEGQGTTFFVELPL